MPEHTVGNLCKYLTVIPAPAAPPSRTKCCVGHFRMLVTGYTRVESYLIYLLLVKKSYGLNLKKRPRLCSRWKTLEVVVPCGRWRRHDDSFPPFKRGFLSRDGSFSRLRRSPVAASGLKGAARHKVPKKTTSRCAAGTGWCYLCRTKN